MPTMDFASLLEGPWFRSRAGSADNPRCGSEACALRTRESAEEQWRFVRGDSPVAAEPGRERRRHQGGARLGEGPQVQADPTQRPFALMRRVASSPGLRVTAFIVATAGLAGIAWAVWVGVTFLMALFQAFRTGR